MLDRARQLATKQGVRNVDWHQGDVYLLPYAADTFTIVVTRYSFHHLLDPAAALRAADALNALMISISSPGLGNARASRSRTSTRSS